MTEAEERLAVTEAEEHPAVLDRNIIHPPELVFAYSFILTVRVFSILLLLLLFVYLCSVALSTVILVLVFCCTFNSHFSSAYSIIIVR